MIWTHVYDLILKLLTMFLSIAILSQIPYLEDNSILLILLAVVSFFFLYNYFARTVATYLYCKLTLKMNVDLAQAKQLNGAFSPFFPSNMQWLPMKGLKNVDDAIKYEVALETYQKWAEEKKLIRKQQVQDFKNAGQGTKIRTVAMNGLVVYCLIAGFMNWPPATFVTEAYCKLFNTTEYYPVLNGCILAIPIILLFRVVDRKIP